MGNQEHLEILWQGVEVWNEWREKNPDVNPDFNGENLSVANLKGANLAGALLNRATLTGANLAEANFSRAYLNEANLSGAKLSAADLSGAKLTGAILTEADFSSANLTEAYLNGAYATGANFIEASLDRAVLHEAHCNGACVIGASLVEANLSEADFSVADLSAANFSKAILSRINFFAANLTGADLSEAQLTEAQALATKFEKATLTGVCLQDWNINSSTNFDDVICDYVYLKRGQQERRPYSGKFAPGEFTKLFQEIEDTIDLIFRNGINWRAFAVAFNQVNAQILDTNEEGEIFLREYKVLGDGLIALKVTTPPGIDKVKVRDELINCYKKIASLEGELKTKNELLAPLYERLLSPGTQISQKTVNIQNIQNVEGNNNLVSEPNKQYTFQAPVGSVENQGHIASSGNQNNIGNAAGEAKAEMKSIQHIQNYAPEQKQTLAASAADIQQLLKQLEQTNPSATEAEQIEHINNETSPNFKRRFASALQAFGETAIDEFVLENKWLKVIKETGKRWIKPD
jgi:uncharacterized protein YjbI with pentapeptide repeats